MGSACGPTMTTYESGPAVFVDTGLDDGAASDGSGDASGSSDGVDPGPTIDGDRVDCATLPAGGDTVAGGQLTPLGFPEYRCDPRIDTGSASTEYQCCSVDPAAENGLPSYQGKDIGGGSIPLFAGANNGLGIWGMCVRTADASASSSLAEVEAAGCPVPCNPRWSPAAVDLVCGSTAVCCQTHELRPADCVLDPDTGQWRAVTGFDIGVLTDWASTAHDTHQDPSGVACASVAGGDVTSPVFVNCIRQLTVADQRGVCMNLGAGAVCPDAQPTYVDACAAMNG